MTMLAGAQPSPCLIPTSWAAGCKGQLARATLTNVDIGLVSPSSAAISQFPWGDNGCPSWPPPDVGGCTSLPSGQWPVRRAASSRAIMGRSEHSIRSMAATIRLLGHVLVKKNPCGKEPTSSRRMVADIDPPTVLECDCSVLAKHDIPEPTSFSNHCARHWPACGRRLADPRNSLARRRSCVSNTILPYLFAGSPAGDDEGRGGVRRGASCALENGETSKSRLPLTCLRILHQGVA
ncbi:hypothetical protein BDV95DRAFT_593364 [Massariosphaeria phaeospora]|uniref:Uncharacterized protein n=1 Tax=Massariosphaeria phaeospora TaxID=100035 RepID=A0A7C8I810_9PLEO|nr:hypothetical protein BDV95DRAFT_593364 [Massariosphaeria phaeospora]